jgi:hypothetical protein
LIIEYSVIKKTAVTEASEVGNRAKLEKIIGFPAILTRCGKQKGKLFCCSKAY